MLKIIALILGIVIAVLAAAFFVWNSFTEKAVIAQSGLSEYLADALDKQEALTNPIEVTYEQKLPGHEKNNMELHIYYVRMQDTLHKMEIIKNDSGYYYKSTAHYDAETKEEKRLDQSPGNQDYGEINNEPKAFWGTQKLDPIHYGYDSKLSDDIRQGEVTGFETIKGAKCVRIEIVFDSDGGAEKKTVWLDSKIGYMPRQVELTYPSGKTTAEWYDYREVAPNAFFPYKQTVTSIYSAGTLVTTTQVSKVEAKTNKTKDDLTVMFPAGTNVKVDKETVFDRWEFTRKISDLLNR